MPSGTPYPEKQVLAWKASYEAGESSIRIAREFKLDDSTLRRVLRRDGVKMRSIRTSPGLCIAAPDGMKVCGNCEQVKPTSDFSFRRDRGHLLPTCKKCVNERQMRHHRRKNYRISTEEYDGRLAAQESRCAICKSEISGRNAHLDHSHTSGKVREFLCPKCNCGLGNFQDNALLLRSAGDYLDRHK